MTKYVGKILGNSAGKLRHPKCDAYSAEQGLLHNCISNRSGVASVMLRGVSTDIFEQYQYGSPAEWS